MRGILLGEIAESKQGLATTDNKRFLRLWFEISYHDIKFKLDNIESAAKTMAKWFPYNKGGDFRKWYGNNDYVVNYQNDGEEIKRNVLRKYTYLKTPDFVVKNTNYYFKKCFSWSLISSSVAAFRYKEKGFIFDVAGMSCFSADKLYYLLALCNSICAMKLLEVIAPTINYQCGDIANIPVIFDNTKKIQVDELVKENINISKQDWDSFETSWNFEGHPLM